MKTYIFDIENQPSELNDALLSIDNISPSSDISLDIWGSVGKKAIIDLKSADNSEIIINKLEIQIPNAISIKFMAKRFAIKIKELIFKCGGIDYQGGAEIENLAIFTHKPQVSINSDSMANVLIQAVPCEDEETIRNLLSAIEMIPGCGEFVYDPECSEAKRSLAELKNALPNVKWIAPVVAWFADSLEIDKCKIKPGIDRNYGDALCSWQVGGYYKDSAHLISLDEKNNSVYGGSVNDQSVIKYLHLLKENGLNIIFYPLIMVDVKGKPWRGRIGASGSDEDRIKNASYIEEFFNNQYRPFIIHYAKLVKDEVDAFIIGSELIGLTSIRDQNKNFPFVKKLVELAYDVRRILGIKVKITYASDWSEYHSVPGGLRPLDELWASGDIDFVGIDAYFPITDLKTSRISAESIKEGWRSGEGYDYYYSNGNKVPFKSSEPWTRWKDLDYWWHSEHWAWDNETKQSIKTSWMPKSKPIWFTEFGFPSIDKAPNKPNVFYDPKSSEGNVPTHSSGKIDNAVQLRAIRATLETWQDSEFLEQMILWTWDARGLGWQDRRDYYADGDLWAYGHWLDGKIACRTLQVKGDIKKAASFVVMGEYLYIDANIEAAEILIEATDNIQIGGTIKKATKFILKGKEIDIHTDIEAEEILVEAIENINIHNNLTIIKNAFLKCQNLDLKTQISGKALFIKALKVALNKDIQSLELLSIKAETLDIGLINLRIAQIIFDLSKHIHIANPHISSNHNVTHDGGKTTTTVSNQSLSKQVIEAMHAEFIVGGAFVIPPIVMNVDELIIVAKELTLDVITTDHTRTVNFVGKKNWQGHRQEWTETTFVQTAHEVEFNNNNLTIEVAETFTAKASKINTKQLSIEAKNYVFQGKDLTSYVSKDGHTKRNLFTAGKTIHGSSKHASVEGVEVIVADTAYMIAHDQIWLQASSVSAEQLVVNAPKIVLQALIGSHYHNMSVSQKGVKLALTCNAKEISGGIEAYRENHQVQQYQQYSIPSIMQGRDNLIINANTIHQHGSILSGRSGNITANSWTSSAPALTQGYSASHERTSMGASVGMRQNVSSAIEGLEHTSKALENYTPSNELARINLASDMYGNFRALTGLAGGGIVNAGAWLSANASSSSTRSSHVSYAMSQADFERLEAKIAGELSGELELNANEQEIKAGSTNLSRKEEESHYSQKQNSLSIGTSGYSASYYQEQDKHGFGLGYSSSFGGGGAAPSAFGPELRMQYARGNNRLDATYASMDTERVAEAWKGGARGIYDRAAHNITTQTNELIRLVSSPNNTITNLGNQLIAVINAVGIAQLEQMDSQEQMQIISTSSENGKITQPADNKLVVNNRELTEQEKQEAYSTLEHTLPLLYSKTATTEEKEAAAKRITTLKLPDNYSGSLSREQLTNLISLSIGKPVSISLVVTEITEQALPAEQQGIIKQALSDVGLVLNKASKNIAKFEQKHPLAAIIIEGQIEAWSKLLFPLLCIGEIIVDKGLDTKYGKAVSKFADDYIVAPVFKMAGINPVDEEYKTGKLTLKTLTYMFLMKKSLDISNSAFIKFYPKQHYYKTGVQYKISGPEKILEQIDLNKISLKKAQKLLIKQGHSAAEAQQLESFFANSAKLQLKPEVIAESRKMKLKGGIQNQKIYKDLIKDGSDIDDWRKAATRTIKIGNNKGSIHFYQNLKNGQLYTDNDFKFKFEKIGKK